VKLRISAEKGTKTLARSSMPSSRHLLALVALATAIASPVFAQQGIRPSDEQLEAPPLQETEPPPGIELPPPPALSPEEEARLSAGELGFVSKIRVEGSSVFSEETFSALMAPYEGRLLSTQDLYAARDAISRIYHEKGYITSGAVLPDQEVDQGVVVLKVIEGRLTNIDIEGTQAFHPQFFKRRLALAGARPVNIQSIERTLQVLQKDALIKKISANLLPADERGESRLQLVVEEALGLRLDVSASNHRPPSIGEYAGEFDGAFSNVFGVGDVFGARYRIAEGLRDYDLAYKIPVNRFDTLLTVGYRDSRGKVVLDEFDAIDIRSKSQTWSVGVEQPLYRDFGRELRVGLIGDLRKSETELLQQEFCTITGVAGPGNVSTGTAFEPFGQLDCDPRVFALRAFGQLIVSGQKSAFAIRSTFTYGVDALGATRNPNTVADGRFYAWLGQAQFIYRLPEALLDTQIVSRLDTQLASDALLSIEKFSVGGARTVRGYRENQLVRDNGVSASLEARIPVIRSTRAQLNLTFVPFVDYGRAWDKHGPGQQDLRTIASIGAGFQFELYGFLRGELFYGGKLGGADGEDGDGLQRRGLHFRVVVDTLAPWR
jgi:hemolysin activation/secretion protein